MAVIVWWKLKRKSCRIIINGLYFQEKTPVLPQWITLPTANSFTSNGNALDALWFIKGFTIAYRHSRPDIYPSHHRRRKYRHPWHLSFQLLRNMLSFTCPDGNTTLHSMTWMMSAHEFGPNANLRVWLSINYAHKLASANRFSPKLKRENATFRVATCLIWPKLWGVPAIFYWPAIMAVKIYLYRLHWNSLGPRKTCPGTNY